MSATYEGLQLDSGVGSFRVVTDWPGDRRVEVPDMRVGNNAAPGVPSRELPRLAINAPTRPDGLHEIYMGSPLILRPPHGGVQGGPEGDTTGTLSRLLGPDGVLRFSKLVTSKLVDINTGTVENTVTCSCTTIQQYESFAQADGETNPSTKFTVLEWVEDRRDWNQTIVKGPDLRVLDEYTVIRDIILAEKGVRLAPEPEPVQPPAAEAPPSGRRRRFIGGFRKPDPEETALIADIMATPVAGNDNDPADATPQHARGKKEKPRTGSRLARLALAVGITAAAGVAAYTASPGASPHDSYSVAQGNGGETAGHAPTIIPPDLPIQVIPRSPVHAKGPGHTAPKASPPATPPPPATMPAPNLKEAPWRVAADADGDVHAMGIVKQAVNSWDTIHAQPSLQLHIGLGSNGEYQVYKADGGELGPQEQTALNKVVFTTAEDYRLAA